MKAWLKGKLDGEVETPLVWKRVEKQELLADKSHSLSAERFLGGEASPFETVRVPLGDIATFEYGHTATAGETGDARYIRITDIDEYGCLRPNDAKFIPLDKEAKASLARKGDVFVARIGATAGKTLLFNSTAPAVFASYLIRVRLDPEKALPEFYWCLTQSKQYWEQREQLVSGGGQPQLNANALKLIEIPLPPLEEQRRIVAEIEGYQKVLDGARQILAGYIPRVEVSPDWPTVEIGEVAEFKNGVNYSKESAGKGIKVLGVRHFQSHVVAPLDDLDEINPDGILSDGHVLEDGDLIFVCSNGSKELVGRCLLVQPKGIRVTHSAFTIRMRLDRKRCEPKFYALLLRLPEFRAQMMGGGANINNLSQDILKAIEIPLPPLTEQRRLVAELDAEAAQMDSVRSLLPRFEAKIQRVLDRVWGNGAASEA